MEERSQSSKAQTFRAWLAAILEFPYEGVPELSDDEEVVGWRLRRWLGGLGLGLVETANPSSFSWAGPCYRVKLKNGSELVACSLDPVEVGVSNSGELGENVLGRHRHSPPRIVSSSAARRFRP